MQKKIIFVLLIAGLILGVIDVFINRNTTSYTNNSSIMETKKINPERDIGVIRINGPITFSKTGMFDAYSVAQKAINDIKYFTRSGVDAVIIRINSPGGTPSSVQEIVSAMEKFKESGSNKKIIVSIKETAASGGYYVACYGDIIVANPASLTGSIGVIMTMPNYRGLFEKLGVEYNIIKSGEYKDIGNFSREMKEDEKEMLQSSVDDIFEQFLEAVSSNRDMEMEEIKAYADGRIFTGRQAYNKGLVDYLGDMDKAVEKAQELAGISDNYNLVYPAGRKTNLWDLIGELSN
ncbi:MAG: signal peptide peptidase SppA [Candidatus Muiribacteriota bacterium]